MVDEINEQLILLQKELSRLKKATDQIDSAKKNSANIVSQLAQVQENYKAHLDHLLKLYEDYGNQVKTTFDKQINARLGKLEQKTVALNSEISESVQKLESTATDFQEEVDISVHKIEESASSFESNNLDLCNQTKKLINDDEVLIGELRSMIRLITDADLPSKINSIAEELSLVQEEQNIHRNKQSLQTTLLYVIIGLIIAGVLVLKFL